MALFFGDSFDGDSEDQAPTKWNAGWGTAGGGVITTSGGGRNGTRGAGFFDHGAALILFPTVRTGIIQAFGVKFSSTTGGLQRVATFQVNDGNGARDVCVLYANSAGGLTVMNGAGGDRVDSIPAVLVAGAFGHVQWKIETTWGAGSGGTLSYTTSVRWNDAPGTPLINAATGSITGTGVHGINQMGILWGNGGQVLVIDDYYLIDMTDGVPPTDWSGDLRGVAIFPSGVGNWSGFTASSFGMDNYLMVLERPHDGDTTYNFADSNLKDSYKFPPISLPVGSQIYGIQENMVVRKDNAGSAHVALLTRPTTTDYLAPTMGSGVLAADGGISVGDQYVTHWKMWNHNPDTNADWLQAEYNVSEFGLARTGP